MVTGAGIGPGLNGYLMRAALVSAEFRKEKEGGNVLNSSLPARRYLHAKSLPFFGLTITRGQCTFLPTPPRYDEIYRYLAVCRCHASVRRSKEPVWYVAGASPSPRWLWSSEHGWRPPVPRRRPARHI